ncbi:cyclic GMP-AMP synthase-like [Lithobates pipiens]
MATRPKKQGGNSTDSGKDRNSKEMQESKLSTCSEFQHSNSVHSDGNGKAKRKTQQPNKKNNSASMVNGTDICVSTTSKCLVKCSAKKKEEILQQTTSGQIETKPSVSMKAKETTSKSCRRSKSVEQNDLGISQGQVHSKAPKETNFNQGRSKTELHDLDAKTKRDHCMEKSDPKRRNSKINDYEDTYNSARDRDEIRSQASRSNSLPISNLSKHLKNAVESLKMKMDDISKAAEKVNKIIDLIIKSESTKSHPLFKSMTKMSTGSYYEGVKISNPNEFDIMLKISFESYHTIELTSIDEGGAFYTLAFKKRKPSAMSLYIDGEGNILAKHILDEFRTLVNTVLKQSGKPASVERKDPSSPAITLTISNEPENISVDLVLALQIRQWPESASNGMNIDGWLGTKVKQDYRKEPCYVVAKQKDKKDTWRISFSNIEKDIISNHGSAKTCCERQGPMCCRKQCLKLMKYILKQLKERGNRRMNQFYSYHAKTALLHTCVQFPKDEDWKQEDLHICFNRYVEFFQKCLKTYSLPNFFIPSQNLFSPDEVDKASCNYLLEELEMEKAKNYPIFLKRFSLDGRSSTGIT